MKKKSKELEERCDVRISNYFLFSGFWAVFYAITTFLFALLGFKTPDTGTKIVTLLSFGLASVIAACIARVIEEWR